MLTLKDLVDNKLAMLATADDYAIWLEGYIECGGEPTHSYSHRFNVVKDWFIPYCDFELPRLVGSDSVNLIIPDGVSVHFSNLGHNSLYYMWNFDKSNLAQVPIFDSVEFSDARRKLAIEKSR